MRWGVVTFPGSLDERDTVFALERALGDQVVALWHKDEDLKGSDCVILPGGFSYGDYLRPGAIARFAPIMREVVRFAQAGGLVMGICNGFQILCEVGLLPGALVRNHSLTFVCTTVTVRVEANDTPFTRVCAPGEQLTIPIKHGAGCFVTDPGTLQELESRRQVVLRYVDQAGNASEEANPNGSLSNIAGVVNASRNVFGMMPHPEHACEQLLGSEDGVKLFRSVSSTVAAGSGLQEPSVPPGV